MGCETPTASTPSPTLAPPVTDAGSLGLFTRLAPRLPLTLTPVSEPSARLLALARVPALPTCSSPGVGVTESWAAVLPPRRATGRAAGRQVIWARGREAVARGLPQA